MKLASERFSLPAAPLPADNNIRHQYPIHKGKWIVHPDVRANEVSFCRYTLGFALTDAATIELHVSADNRFELRCDGNFIGMGPDRSDIEHWSFHSYRLTLEPGSHELVADVHFLGLSPVHRPYAQACIEPGFVLYSETSPVDLNTGSASWMVARLDGVSVEKADLKTFFVVGPNFTIDAKSYFGPARAVVPAVLREAGRNIQSGTILPGWKLYPSRLPEQVRRPVGGGRIRSVSAVADSAPFPGAESAACAAWQAFIEGQGPVTLSPHARQVVLWDLEQYHTAYPELTVSGGIGGRVRLEWAESCFDSLEKKPGENSPPKGNRDEVAGKYFMGNGDTFLPDGDRRTFRPFWWRAGRYVRIVVETADEPLTLIRIALQESRLPLENESLFGCDDPAMDGIVRVSTRGIQMCSHETYMDCPYYEQLMYVGDTRIQMLTSYVMSSEDRLNQRALEIFDWSRQETGFVHERCPSQPKQLSATFAMIWILMLRDYAWWRRDEVFLRQRLKGMRCLLEEFKAIQGDLPMLPALPGWSFVDWVDGLSFVNNPGSEASVSSVVNLLFINALNSAAEVEDALGEKHLADYNRAWAKRISGAVDATFWDEARGLFADDPAHRQYSEHAQCLALLSGQFTARESRCFESLVSAGDLLRATVYFSFYLLEVLARFKRPDLILEKIGFWKEMVAIGMKTPIETPEPSRSDCHAWSSHPLFHMHASLAGIRPASPGFATVRIEPQPGSLTELRSSLPHPAGIIEFSMKKGDRGWHARVSLPAGLSGTLCWGAKEHGISGVTELSLGERSLA